MTRYPACGLLFDIDGTLADTDRLHMQAFNDIMARFGICFDHAEYKAKVMGRTNEAIFADLLPNDSADYQMSIAHEKEAAFRVLAAGKLEPTPGLMQLLAWTERNRIPCACVTNAPRLNADLILAGLGLARRFQAEVLADDLPHGKPHPLPYREGAARIGAEIARCVAFEDSKSGTMSAVAAGAVTVGVMSSLDAAEFAGLGAHLAIRDFTDPRLMPLIEATFAAAA